MAERKNGGSLNHHSTENGVAPLGKGPFAAFLAVLGLLAFTAAVPAGSAPLTGTMHDLTAETGAPSLCRECHLPHQSLDRALWTRDMVPDAGTTDALCLDCHDPDRSLRPSTPPPPSWASQAADAGSIRGSLHDFADRPWVTRGTCSACHELHLPDTNTIAYQGSLFTTGRIWNRDLTEEITGLYQKRNLAESADVRANYLVGSTVLCLDCHSGTLIDSDPNILGAFAETPQDIAFGGDRQTTPGGTVGYYELPDGSEPNSPGDAPTMDQVAASPDVYIPGGHYVQTAMAAGNTTDNYEVRTPDGDLLYRISVGDKLPCELCHDPHRGEISAASDDEVFFRRKILAGEDSIVENNDSYFSGTVFKASPNSRAGQGVGEDDGTGRGMCQWCHGSSDWDGSTGSASVGINPLLVDTAPDVLTVFGIKVRTTGQPDGSTAFPPPSTVGAHGSGSVQPCTDCHGHNNLKLAGGGCLACHQSAKAAEREVPAEDAPLGINPSDFESDGHGSNSWGFQSGRECEYCHLTTGDSHPANTLDVANNPYRLRTWSPGNPNNQVCLSCHATGDTGVSADADAGPLTTVNSSANVDTAHWGTKHAGQDGGRWCWDCHNPHGNGTFTTNAKLVWNRPAVLSSTNSGLLVGSTTRAVVFSNLQGKGTDYAPLGTFTGVCQVCHTDTSLQWHVLGDLTKNEHNNTPDGGTVCTTCHQHDEVFAPAGCDTCHGDGAGSFWPDSTPVDEYPDRGGAHLKHVTAIGTDNSSCSTCHPGTPPPPLGHPDDTATGTSQAELSRMDLDQNGSADAWTGSYFKDISGQEDTDAVFDAAAKTCSNINCHSNQTTPAWYAGGGGALTNPPDVTGILVNGSPQVTVSPGAPVTVTATVTDPDSSTVIAAEYFVDTIGSSGNGTAMAASDGSFDGASEAVRSSPALTTDSWSVGDHSVYVHGQDGTDGWGPISYAQITVAVSDTLQAAGTNQAPVSSVDPGSLATMLRVDGNTLSGQTTVTQFTVDLTGSQDPGDISRAYVYLDDGDDLFETTQDTAIGSKAVSAVSTTIPVSGTVVDISGRSLFIAYRISSSATADNTVGAQITAIAVDPLDAVTGLPLASGTTPVKSAGGGGPSTEILHPQSLASATGWSAADWAGDLDASGDATATGGSARNDEFVLNMDDHSVTGDPAIDSVVIKGTCRLTAANQEVFNFGGTGANDQMTAWTFSVQGVYQEVSHDFGATNPWTVSPWTWDDINALQVKQITSGSGKFDPTGYECDEIRLEISYTTAAAPTYPPVTFGVTANGDTDLTVQRGTPVSLAATSDDTDGGGHIVTAAEYFFDSLGSAGSGTAMAASDGAFDAATEVVVSSPALTTDSWTVGDHFVYVDGQDGTDGWGDAAAVKVTIYDGDNVALSASDSAPAQAVQGGRYAFLRMQLAVDTNGDGSAVIDRVRLVGAGTAGDSDLSGVSIFDDSGSVPDSWDAGDLLLGSGVLSAGTTTVDISDQTVVNGTPKVLHAVMTLSSTANETANVGVTVDDSFITVAAPDVMAPAPSVTSSLADIVAAGGGGINCGDCHAIPPATGSHTGHADGDTDYTDCYRCHTDNGGLGYQTGPQGIHNNGSVTLDTTNVGWVAASQSCATVSCHSAASNRAFWGSQGSIQCDECHYWASDALSVSAVDNSNHPDPVNSTHNLHFDRGKYCTECHGDNSGDTAAPRAHITSGGADDGEVLEGRANALQDEATVDFTGASTSYLFSDVPNTCSSPTNNGLGCHATGTADWDDPATADFCTDCHTDMTTTAVNPQSGLHDETPVVSGVRHGEAYTYGGGASSADCTTCHTAAPSTAHQNGIFNASVGAAAPTPYVIQFAGDVNFTDSVTPTCAPAAGLSGCHVEQSVGESWSRLWYDSADGRPDTTRVAGSECAGCHGDWTSGWNAGVKHRRDSGPQSTHGTGTDYQCKDCHALEAAAGYTFASSTGDWNLNAGETSDHGNTRITVNINGTSFARSTDGILSGCGACHDAFGGTTSPAHSFTTTGWNLQTVTGDGIEAGCDSCHGNGGQYWPQLGSTAATDYPNRSAKHGTHLNALAARIGYSYPTTNDTEQRHMCEYCHNDPNGVGGSNHNDNVIPASVGGFNPIWDTGNPPTTPDGGAAIAGTGINRTCSGVDCHYNNTTPSWYGTRVSDCTLCHNNGTDDGQLVNAHPGSGRHATHVASNVYVPDDCATCHGTGGNTGAQTGHQSGGPSFGSSLSSYDGTTATCVNTCHAVNDGAGDWADGNPLFCTRCHSGTFIAGDNSGTGGSNYLPQSGLHDQVPIVSGVGHGEAYTYGGGTLSADCTTCHTGSPSSAHLDGTFDATIADPNNVSINFSSGVNFVDSVVPTCSPAGGLAGCHLDAGKWGRLWHEDAEAQGGSGTECAGCHGTFTQSWVNGIAPSHTADWDGDGTSAEMRNNHDNGAVTETEFNQCVNCHVFNAADYLDQPAGETPTKLGWVPGGTSTNHGNNLITMNSAASYSSATWSCGSACHTDNTGHVLSDSGWPVSLIAGPAPDCTGCHDGTGAGGLAVSVNSPHAQNNTDFNFTGTGVTTGTGSQGCKDCHFTGHDVQETNTVNIPNFPALGISYSQAGGSGVYITDMGNLDGGTKQGTVAEVCWRCHELATNQGARFLEFNDTGAWHREGHFTGGTSWDGATWTSSDHAYKSNLAIQSTHDVGDAPTATNISNPLGTTGGSDTAGPNNYQCGWCHDVHGIMDKGAGGPYPRRVSQQTYSNGPAVAWTGDAKVFLRGIWYSSPYLEDGAPGAGSVDSTGGFTFPANTGGFVDGTDSATATGTWGPTLSWNPDQTQGHLVGPNHLVRIQANTGAVQTLANNDSDWPRFKWGAHIDDNVYGTTGFTSFNPITATANSTVTLNTPNHIDYSQSNNLCMRCHGDVTALIGLWSGHGAVSGAPAQNDIFTPRMAVSQHYMYNVQEGEVARNTYQAWGGVGWNNLGYSGELASDNSWGSGGYYDWSVDMRNQAAGAIVVDTELEAKSVGGNATTPIAVPAGGSPVQKFHQFTCSKCHSPHASANARLMVTNCMNRDGTGANTFNERHGMNTLATQGLDGASPATDTANILTTLPEAQVDGRTILDPWIGPFGGHERAVHCHNNVEQGGPGTFWQSIPPP